MCEVSSWQRVVQLMPKPPISTAWANLRLASELKIFRSGAKFHEEADSDVENSRGAPKSRENYEKLMSKTFFLEIVFSTFWGIAKRRRRLEF